MMLGFFIGFVIGFVVTSVGFLWWMMKSMEDK